MQPKVSIIVPTYNVENYLVECMESIVNQTLKDIEIICVDDGSKDNSGKILDEYASKDCRIKVIHKENGGYGKAMNVGLDHATGEYIGIVEPDDYIDLEMYEKLYNLAKNNNSDMAKSPYYVNLETQRKHLVYPITWNDNRIPKGTFEGKKCPYLLLNHPSIWSAIYKTAFIKNNSIRFIEAPGAGWTDNPFWFQVVYLASRVNYTPEVFYFWRVLDENSSDALRDYTLPFKRCSEIQDWITKNNIKDKNYIEAFYKKEFIYILIVLRKKKIENPKDCISRINKMISKMDGNLVMESNILSNYEKSLYKIAKKSAKSLYIKIRVTDKIKLKLKTISENIFSVKNMGIRKVFTFMGLKIKVKSKKLIERQNKQLQNKRSVQ
mgnify:CR=1 FL=1